MKRKHWGGGGIITHYRISPQVLRPVIIRWTYREPFMEKKLS